MRPLLRTATSISAFALVMGAGFGAFAEPMTDRSEKTASTEVRPMTAADHQRSTYGEVTRTQADRLHFMSYGDVVGLDVHGNADESIAKVTDAIIDANTGGISHLIVTQGSVLGMGGSSIAVPYGVFGQGFGEDGLTLRLDMNAEQLKKAPAFDPAQWGNLQHETFAAKVGEFFMPVTNAWQSNDAEIAKLIAAGDLKTFSGEVVRVQRFRSLHLGERVALHLKDDAGVTRIVHLGPSWYVMSQKNAPKLGVQIKTNAVSIPDKEREFAAATISTGGDVLNLRDAKTGEPRWDARTHPTAVKTDTSRSQHLMLGSDLTGANVDAAGEDGGHIASLIIERTSGVVAFVVIDPDDATMDINEQNHLAPYAAFAIETADQVKFSRNREALLTSPIQPKSADDYNNQTYRHSIYKTYGIETPSFDADRDAGEWLASDGLGGWSADGPYATAMNGAKTRDISGVVARSQVMKLHGTLSNSQMVVLDSDDGAVTIHLGPAWYMKQQGISLKAGQAVHVTVAEIKLDGKKILAATSLKSGDKTYALVDANHRPVWDAASVGE